MKKIILVLSVLGLLLVVFARTYDGQLSEFKNTSTINANLLHAHIEVSDNFIKGIALHGNLYMEQDTVRDSEYFPLLKYDPALDSYHMDAAGGTEQENFLVGNLTGMGKIPENGDARKELNLALEFNRFFSSYYEGFPDVAWLYYTSNQNFLNIYPWISSEHFKFSDHLKTVPFFTVANPENNPQRSRVWTSAYYDEAGKGLMVTLSTPIYDNDTFLGVVSLDMTNQQLNHIIESQFEGFLIDQTNTVLAYNRSDIANHSIVKVEELLRLSASDLSEMKALEEDTVQRWGGYYIYSVSFEDAPWRLFYRVPIWLVVGKSLASTIPFVLISLLLFRLVYQIERRKKSEELLRQQKELVKTTLFSINQGIIVTDQSGKIAMMNPLAEQYTGWTKEEAIGREFGDVVFNINLQTREKGVDFVKLALETGESNQSRQYAGIRSKDGVETYILGGASPIFSEEGDIAGAVVAFRDISKEYEQEKEIEGFLNLSLDIFCVTDTDGIMLRANQKLIETLGYDRKELEGLSLLTYVVDEDLPESLAVFEKVKNNVALKTSFTNRYRCKDGSIKSIEWLSEEKYGKYIYHSARDVSQKVLETERLETLAVKDQLTGLYNRHYLESIIENAIDKSDQNHVPLSMILMDIDHFKKVNDTWGHSTGDDVLRQIAGIAAKKLRDTDILIRFGGEEFLIVTPQTSNEGARVAAEKIRSAIEEFHHPVAGTKTASFGVSERMRGESFDHWYQRADEALYLAKNGGRNRVVVSETSLA